MMCRCCNDLHVTRHDVSTLVTFTKIAVTVNKTGCYIAEYDCII
jgi:hypothetical protein